MPVAMLLDNPQGSPEVYEKLREQLGLEAPAGGIMHLAGPSPNGGWRVIEMFESEEDGRRFLKERFSQALSRLGVSGEPVEPQFWPVHNFMK